MPVRIHHIVQQSVWRRVAGKKRLHERPVESATPARRLASKRGRHTTRVICADSGGRPEPLAGSWGLSLGVPHTGVFAQPAPVCRTSANNLHLLAHQTPYKANRSLPATRARAQETSLRSSLGAAAGATSPQTCTFGANVKNAAAAGCPVHSPARLQLHAAGERPAAQAG